MVGRVMVKIVLFVIVESLQAVISQPMMRRSALKLLLVDEAFDGMLLWTGR